MDRIYGSLMVVTQVSELIRGTHTLGSNRVQTNRGITHMRMLRSYISQPQGRRPEQVFIVIKPGFEDKSTNIIRRFERSGFRITKLRTVRLTLNQARGLYKTHKKESWYGQLCKYMSSGVSVGILFEYTGDDGDAFERCSEIKSSIRDLWSESDMRNVLHSSDNPAARDWESSFYF